MNNFTSIFEELNKLYEAPEEEKTLAQDANIEEGWNEEAPLGLGDLYPGARGKGRNPEQNKAPDWWISQGGTQGSWETAVRDSRNNHRPVWEDIDENVAEDEVVEDEAVEDEIPADEVTAEEPVAEKELRQIICGCDKCGALVIIGEADVIVDEETDLVNVEDECQFCEEANGFKIVGVVAPYEVADEAVEDVVEEPTEEEFVEEAVEAPVVEEATVEETTTEEV